MAAFVAVIVYLLLLQTPNIFAAKDEEWKSATATYSKETDGSIVTGFSFPSFQNSFNYRLNYKFRG